MMIFTIALAILVPSVLWYFSNYPRNVVSARRTGLPILFSPVSPANPLWLTFSSTFQRQLAKYLPWFIYKTIARTIYGWQFRHRHSLNSLLPGSVFVLVTPGQNELWLADPDMVTEVLTRSDEFIQTKLSSRIMAFFGSNMLSSNGDEWRRHRKQVAPALNERIMNVVWKESLSQTQQMLKVLVDRSGATTNELIQGIRILVINVISLTGFGAKVSWTRAYMNDKPSSDHSLTFFQTLSTIVDRHFVALLIPTRVLRLSWMPLAVQTIGIAVDEFPRYVAEIIQEQRAQNDNSDNLIKTLVSNLRLNRTDSLTENKIVGNLFNFSIAGSDTTVNTVAYAIMSLAVDPDLQEWFSEEIVEANTRYPDSEYDECYPMLKRSIALMYETLRMYTPVLNVTRRIVRPTTIRDKSRAGEIHIPTDMIVYVSPFLIHMDPKIWPDPLAFRPSRWLDGNGDLIRPSKGHFVPWSAGPRICPGMKMAQVEFVSILRAIVSEWTFEPAGHGGESLGSATQRLRQLIDESQPKMTLQIKGPAEMNLRFQRRV